MKTVTLDVRDPGETIKDFVRVWKTGKPEKSARISFASPELLWKVLTAKRWEQSLAHATSRLRLDARVTELC